MTSDTERSEGRVGGAGRCECQGLADVTLSWYNPGSQDAGSEVGTWALGWRGAPWGGSLQAMGSAPSLDHHRDPGFGWPEGAGGEPCVLWESSWDSRPPAGWRSWALGMASGLPGEGRDWSPWLEGGGRTEISPGPREQGAGLGARAGSRETAGVTEGFSTSEPGVRFILHVMVRVWWGWPGRKRDVGRGHTGRGAYRRRWGFRGPWASHGSDCLKC